MSWTTISQFEGEHRFLSNFYESPIALPSWHPAGGTTVFSVEHAFQSAKTVDTDHAYAIATAPTPGKAKRMGRSVQLRPGWDEGRKAIMVALLRIKFAPGTIEANRLLATGNNVLIEGNTWGDYYWGVCHGRGENWLGRCLMLVRAELDVDLSIPSVGDELWLERQRCLPPVTS